MQVQLHCECFRSGRQDEVSEREQSVVIRIIPFNSQTSQEINGDTFHFEGSKKAPGTVQGLLYSVQVFVECLGAVRLTRANRRKS